MLKVALQGQIGSFHAQAAKHYFGRDIEMVSCRQFKDVFKSVDGGESDCGIIAIENSLYGSINEVYDLLLKYELPICGEIFLRIEHHLLGVSGSKISNIREVYSQAPALAQCSEYIETNLPKAERIEYNDTAASAELIAQLQDPTKVAIASSAAADKYSLYKLDSNIETDKENYTRFVVLGNTKECSIGNTNKTSITFVTADKPGALHEVLGIFADANINLSKLESRPIVGKAWRYCYYLDFSGDVADKYVEQALIQLDAVTSHLRVLGSYKQGEVVHEI